ncbi:MAG: hypothetical protein GY818_15140 [Planctomycetaceae bacterium]|nr:hypothetical protein [Planctomycetaceae bacterium]
MVKNLVFTRRHAVRVVCVQGQWQSLAGGRGRFWIEENAVFIRRQCREIMDGDVDGLGTAVLCLQWLATDGGDHTLCA